MTTIHPQKPSLTTNDSAVLQALFDAESSPSSGVTISSSLPPFPTHLHISPDLHETLQSRSTEIIRTLQPEPVAVETAESAIRALDTLVSEHPKYPPVYMNRAQAIRVLLDSRSQETKKEPEPETETDFLLSPSNEAELSQLLADLSQAITLATPVSPADPVSEVQARVLADAHTHRGYLLLKVAKGKKLGPLLGSRGPERLRALDADAVEEMASRDFFFGGRYGNRVAQQLAVQTNPYAKMCGAIVKEALRKEVVGDD
ncbi:hypothetical protein BDV25DRAFT_171648 [Aspergillus avenaceus]|uniref:Tetratricopeptide repeat protein 36 n=1 Tax=Aspergillus avenaceus TaxID=36643 RepID=A0A5N6TXT5_ASPAV|nr:hypothetical protein BDV25DRAFT_171648 [Aspergillus avenaceus]